MMSTPSTATSGPVTIRRFEPKDVKPCAEIVYDAFVSIADRHNFPRDFPSLEVAEATLGAWAQIPAIAGWVAEIDGRIVGSMFDHMYDEIVGFGPCTVAPAGQNARVGRKLMTAAIEYANGRGMHRMRGVEDSFNLVSNSLYISFGMMLKETLALTTGKLRCGPVAGVEVRPLEERDLAECAALCKRAYGIDRANELRGCTFAFKPYVALRDGRVVAYASSVTYWPTNHGAAETDDDMKALLAGVSAAISEPLSLLIPRRSQLCPWALREGLRMVKPMNLVALGDYKDPPGTWFPNVLF